MRHKTLPIWGVAWRQSVMATLCGLNRHRRLVPYYILEGAVTLALSVWLAHRMGILGVAWAFTLPRIVMSVIALPLIMRAELGLPITSTWIQLVVRPTVAMVPFAAVTFLLERASPAGSLLVFFAQVGLALPAACLGAWVVGFGKGERTYARERLEQVLSPRHAPKPSPVEPA